MLPPGERICKQGSVMRMQLYRGTAVQIAVNAYNTERIIAACRAYMLR